MDLEISNGRNRLEEAVQIMLSRSCKRPKEGFILAGYTYSNDGDVSGHHGSTGSSDYWIVKLEASGDIEWQKSLGGTENDNCVFHSTNFGWKVYNLRLFFL
jgi:hypothetical protein